MMVMSAITGDRFSSPVWNQLAAAAAAAAVAGIMKPRQGRPKAPPAT